MKVALLINNSASTLARYVTWAQSPCSIRLTDTTGVMGPVRVTLRNKPPANKGRVVFQRMRTSARSSTLALALPTSGASVSFFVSGDFPRASTDDRDTIIQVMHNRRVLLEVPLMVRIRKNANRLTAGERDRFVAALARLNNQGTGRFIDFRSMHTRESSPQAHGAPGFLPWHRNYLLDLERELQNLDPSVTLPYWRFDQAAANVFTRDFMGESDTLGTVQFSPANPLQFWRTDGVQGVNRRPLFDTATQSAFVMDEPDTLGLGSLFNEFAVLEGDPHGSAHTSFGGSLSSVPTAARDPLFFLLHANVDRLWAKWQRTFLRFDANDPASFDNTSNLVGHQLDDTMWPWNMVTGGTRPATAPGGTLAPSTAVSAPGLSPRVRDMFDYQGGMAPSACLGFDYDDVRF